MSRGDPGERSVDRISTLQARALVRLVPRMPDITIQDVVVHRGLETNIPAVQRLFTEAALFVQPTHADCLSLVVMEAAALGLPANRRLLLDLVGALVVARPASRRAA